MPGLTGVLAAVRKETGEGLRFLQSRPLFRAAGRGLVRGITVTDASPDELGYVHARLNPGVPHRPSPPDPAVTTLVAVRHGKVVGFVQLVRRPPSQAPYVGYWLHSLSVLHPLYRGTGIGEALARTALEIARREGAEEVNLVVGQTNRPAIGLYRKLGFRHAVLPGLEEQLEEEARRSGSRRIAMVKWLHD